MEEIQRPSFIVGIGASAGGLLALQQFFGSIGNGTGMAFVVVQHLSPDFKSLMPELLAKHTSMPIVVVNEAHRLKPNCIYLIARDRNILASAEQVTPSLKDPSVKINLPIDIFLNSLAQAAEERAIAVIFSGTGTDGSRGVRAVKEMGGAVFVQDPETAKFDGMPLASIRQGVADFVLSPRQIADRLRVLGGRDVSVPAVGEAALAQEDYWGHIVQLVSKHSGVAFQYYREGTLVRRVQKRMQLLHETDLASYSRLVASDPAERQALYQDFLIGVTRFFRDEPAWQSLQQLVVGPLVQESGGRPLRVWSAGCSTGEEPYTLAMMFREAFQREGLLPNFRVFASDADRQAISFASSGAYNDNIGADVPLSLLERYFRKNGNCYEVVPMLREHVLFAVHDLLKDPPFINMDLIVCRNMLIYIKPEVQKRLLSNFQFSLKPHGYLFLGPSENISGLEATIRPLDKAYNIFLNALGSRPAAQLGLMGVTPDDLPQVSGRASTASSRPALSSTQQPSFVDAMMQQFVPPTVFVNEQLQLLYTHGDLRSHLSIPSGAAGQYDLLQMVQESARTDLRQCLARTFKEARPFLLEGAVLQEQAKPVRISTRLASMPRLPHAVVMASIEPMPEAPKGDEAEALSPSPSHERIRLLEIELQDVRHELIRTRQDLETSNEELQASNEELLGANEELQSNNEELQSVNEELYTVNAEFQEKIKELTEVNNDINNLFNSLDAPIVFLDERQQIRKVTPSAKRIFNIVEGDIGRPIGHFTHNLVGQERVDDLVRQVFDQLRPIEKQVQAASNAYFLMRIYPYRTGDQRVSGTLLIFTDITDLRQAYRQVSEHQLLLAEASAIAKFAPWEWPSGSEELVWTDATWRLHECAPESPLLLPQVLTLYEGGHAEGLQEAMLRLRQEQLPFSVLTKLRKSGRWLRVEGRVMAQPDGSAKYYGFYQDVTEDRLQQHEQAIQRHVLQSISDAVIITALDGTITYCNPASEQLYGYGQEALLGHTPAILYPAEDLSKYRSEMQSLRDGMPFRGLWKAQRGDGAIRFMQVHSSLIRNEQGDPIGMVGISDDVTEQVVQQEETQERTQSQLEVAKAYAARMAALSEHLQGLLDAISFPFAIVRLSDQELSYANKELFSLFGLEGKAMEGGAKALFRRNKAVKQALLRKLAETGSFENHEVRLQNSEGARIHALVSARLVELEGKRSVCLSFHNISSLKKAEEEIAMLALVVKETDNMVIITNRQGHTEWVNESFVRMTGYTLADMLGKKPGQVLQGPHTDPEVVAEASAAVREGRHIRFEILNYTKEGEAYWVEVDMQPICDEEGRVARFIALQRNINAYKAYEQTLAYQNEELKKANQELDNFVYRVSHDLRAPITSMMGLGQLMRMHLGEPQELDKLLGMQEQSLRKQDSFIRDILNYSRNARMEVQAVPVRLDTFLAGLLEEFSTGSPVRQVLEVEGEAPYATDPPRLSIILSNLLSNACRYFDPYKPDPYVKVSARISPMELELEVSDNGQGIAPAHLPHIFQMFYRATDRHPGSGLGLYIVQEAVQKLRGRISVSSELGKGTTFRMQLPNMAPRKIELPGQ